MRPGGGKNKGSSYEREIGEKISLWLSHGEHKHLLCRTVGSGAQFTTSAKKLVMAGQAGDLIAQDEKAFKLFAKFVIECKTWRDLELIRFFAKEGLLYDALVKVKGEGEKLGRMYWLISKQNRRKDLILMPVQAFDLLRPDNDWHLLFNGTVYMMQLDSFLSSIEPERFLAIQQEQIPMR